MMMTAHRMVLSAALATMVGCGASELPKPPVAQGLTVGVTKLDAMRGERYCEVLIGGVIKRQIAVEVYNTIGLNDCPEAAWSDLDAEGLARELGAQRVLLNGPRYWTMDRIDGTSRLVDPTPRTFHALAMRMAGRLELPLTDAIGGHRPYAVHDVNRTTVWVFDAGKPVYELVDAVGHAYAMQSFSIQKAPQTIASLATLGERLHPPSGWKFRTRVLDAELRVPAVDSVAHIVQDDFENTYQQEP